MRRDLHNRVHRGFSLFRLVHRVMFIAILMIWLAVILCGAYLLFHPEAIGAFAGRIIAGFRDAA